MRTLLISLLAVLGLAASLGGAPALAQSSQVACESLDRPNIDCACVASRIATFNRVSPTDAAKAVIDQGYLFALAMPNTFSESFEMAMSDPMTAMVTMEAYEGLGGRPENIEDYEKGCVIEDASPAEFAPQSTTPSFVSYVSACTASTGDNRFCSCDAEPIAVYGDANGFVDTFCRLCRFLSSYTSPFETRIEVYDHGNGHTDPWHVICRFGLITGSSQTWLFRF